MASHLSFLIANTIRICPTVYAKNEKTVVKKNKVCYTEKEVSTLSAAETVIHPIPPVYTPQSRVLILGTMPSPRSRQAGFYYAHPQNRFWRVMAAVYEESTPETEEARRAFLDRHDIALWDVLKSCRIAGAADSTIFDPVPNPIDMLLSQTAVRAIFTTGCKAYQLYTKLCAPKTQQPAILLPSTSPANARCSFSRLTEAYQVIRRYTEGV